MVVEILILLMIKIFFDLVDFSGEIKNVIIVGFGEMEESFEEEEDFFGFKV